jgi:iron complex outermembrane recepter protein
MYIFKLFYYFYTLPAIFLTNQNNIFMRKLLLSLSLIFSSYLVVAQQTFTVKVTDAKTGSPVTDASVVVKSSNKGASASSNGIFTITAKPNDLLEITCIGYAPQLIKLTSSTEVNVSLLPASVDLGDIVVVGTRGAARAKTETAVPVDVIKINQVGLPTAKMDLTSVLNMAAPSFNYNKQSGSDGADHVDLGTLRGLGPDQTLVLINGKRRHTTALVGLFGTRGKGASGTDLNAFPQSAVDRIEILRDGASAQYGSDAMAGVINIVLKKDINHWTINTGWAGYYDTKFNAVKFNEGNQYVSGRKIDGQTFTLSASNGFAVGKSGGFVSFSLDYLKQGKTYRQADTSNWQTNKNSLPYLGTGRRAFGDASVSTYGALYNMELPIKNTKSLFYSFASINTKESDAFAYSRNFSKKPERFPVDLNGSLLFVPSIMQIANDGETYYNPRIATKINDASVAFGLKGISARKWNWDASITTGKNDFQFYGEGTFNASLQGNTTKNYFNDGGFRFRQATANLDFSKSFKSVASGLNIGYGFEYRNEKYSINQGEEASYKGYYGNEIIFPNLFGNDPSDSSRALGVGSQGFPGFSPFDTIKANRNSLSVYADAELNVTSKWLVNAAVRAENYSDFGSVVTYKLASRIKAADNFNMRGSISTGFRAPSLQQINFSNTLTSFSGGQLIQSRIARNGDAISKAAGIPDLKEETSLNASVGFAWKPIKGFTVTVDGYMVKLKDRVVLTGVFSGGDPTLPTSFTSQLNALNIDVAQFLSNAVNTTNFGLDVVADYFKKWDNKSFKILLAGNIQNVKIDKINVPVALAGTVLNQKTFYSDREVSLLKASAPASKFTLSTQYNCNKIGFGISLTSFGAIKILGFGAETTENPYFGGINPQVYTDNGGTLIPEVANYKMKIVTDAFISYKFCRNLNVFVGIDNLLNAHPNFTADPTAKQGANGNETGGPWESVQMGYNGRKIFTKLAFNF